MSTRKPDLLKKTTATLKIIGIGTEKVARTAMIDETNPYLRQGNDDHWDTYDQNSFNRQNKYKWLDDTYKNFADGAKSEIIDTKKTIEAAKKIFEHTNAAQGHLQMYQAQKPSSKRIENAACLRIGATKCSGR